MIDNIKFYINDKDSFEHYLEENQIGNLSSIYDRETGELMNYPLTGKFENMRIKITDKSAYILGSIHKYYNLVNPDKPEGNYNKFGLCEFKEAVIHLCSNLSIRPEEVKITNLEFGFNISVGSSPSQIIDNNILMLNYTPPNTDKKFKGKGGLKEFEMTDYSLKVYDKSKQYKLIEENIMRVELKITATRYLQNLGIFGLQDLNETALEGLQKRFYKILNKLLIVDSISRIESLRLDKQVLFNNGINPFFWQEQKSKMPNREFKRLKKDFHEVIQENNLFTLKLSLLDNINNEFKKLLSCEESSGEEQILI